MKTDVLIIGGGIIGACAAYAISKAGMRVMLIEKREIGAGASGTSAAMLETQIDAHRGDPFFPLADASRRLFPALYEETKDLTGMDFQYEQCGLLEMALNEEDKDALTKEVDRQRGMALEADWIDEDSLRKTFPFLYPDHLGGAFFKEDGQVNGERFMGAMIKAAEKKGAVVQTGTGDIEWIRDGKRVSGVKTAKGDYTAGKIVVAAGAWTDQLLSPLSITLGIEPIRGQLAVYQTPNCPLPHPLYTRTRGYITPKKDGYTFVGSTVEKVGFDESTTEEGKNQLAEVANTLFPGLLRRPFRGLTAGLRPGSPDELPIIGPLPHHPNIIVASGHYRNGILLAPITADIVTGIVTSSTPPIDPTPFSPARFL